MHVFVFAWESLRKKNEAGLSWINKIHTNIFKENIISYNPDFLICYILPMSMTGHHAKTLVDSSLCAS